MTQMYQEYNASATNARSCYSNLDAYGANGMWRPIIPPTPMTVQPQVFNLMRPHSTPKSGLKSSKAMNERCGPYAKLGETCRQCWK